MKEQLEELIGQLMAYEPNLDCLALLALFEKKAPLFQEDVQVPHDFLTVWYTLSAIKSLLDRWQYAYENLELVKKLNLQIRDNQERLKATQAYLQSETKQFDEINKDIEQRFQIIYEVYKEAQLREDPLKALPQAARPKERLLLVKQHLESANRELSELNFIEFQLTLANNLQRCQQIKKELNYLNLGDFSYSSSSLQESIEKLAFQIKEYSHLVHQLAQVHEQLALSLSKEDIDTHINNYELALFEINREIEDLEKSITRDNIEIETKQILMNQFEMAVDKQAFLETWKSQQTWSQSSLNPASWYQWKFDSSYAEKLAKNQEYINFLELLNKKFEFDHKKNLLNEKLKNAQNLLLTSSTSSSLLHSDSDLLREEVTKLLAKIKHGYSLPEQATYNDMMSDIISVMSPLSMELTRMEKGIGLLSEYQKLDSESIVLRTKHVMLKGNEKLRHSEELSKLKDTQPSRLLKIQQLNEEIALCDSYLKKIPSLEETQKTSKNLENLLKKLNKERDILVGELKSLNNVSQNERQIQMENYSSDIEKHLKELRHHSEQPTIPAEIEKEIPPPAIPVISKINTDEEGLNKWNQAILKRSQCLPEELAQWYQQLFKTLEQQANNEHTFLQTLQLLRDIYFELKYPEKSGLFSVLQAYRQICPQPEQDWQNLLALKPPLPINPSLLKPILSSKLKTQISKLYEHHRAMKAKHPREALLLEQITQNVHHMANNAEHSQVNLVEEYLHPTLNDPRYQSLQKHRGFLKVVEWLAEACTTLLELINYKQADDYRHRFFFVPTKSTDLLQDVSQELLSL